MTMDRLIQFRRATMVDDGIGQEPVFSDYGAPVWAAKQDVSDGERLHAGQVGASLTTRFIIRWSQFANSILPSDRVIADGYDYDILWMKEIGRRRFIEISAQARAD